MTSVFCAISLIKNVSGGNNSCTGTATYRVGEDEFQDFTFKAFYTNDNNNNMIAEIFKSSISLVVGRLSLEGEELYTTMLQYVPLNILTIDDQASKYDLPISSAFMIFTAPIHDIPIAEGGDKAIFRLKKDNYNTITSNHIPTSVICKYNPAGRFSSVKDAATRRPIFSVGGELIPLKKSICILPDVIEWNYPLPDNQQAQQMNERGNQLSSPSKRQRREELERTAQKFETRQTSYRSPITTSGQSQRTNQQNSPSRHDILSSAMRSVQSNSTTENNTTTDDNTDNTIINNNEHESVEENDSDATT
nr:8605_t:CDS:2 [Entrophospora candida]CAG8631583.1 12883_t:CDS:2 [Entrophospora candida]